MNPFIWLRDWCLVDLANRGAELDLNFNGEPQVELHYQAGGELHYVQASGATFDEAVLAARALLPTEVRR